ncbi:hypothetical protein [Diaphorobacter nitroreducens]|uniref:hypothetical protein n=1 Tax=Diaphorobacter nitroreducens TaxID=164759 RepID=UPI0028B1854F|nr:hypothetical protein [Diaphorobacter nitroreducens]
MSKFITAVRMHANKIAVGATALGLSTLASAQAADPIGDMLDAVGLSGVSAKVIALGLLVVGVALAFKGPDVAKRIIRKI